MTGIDDGDGGDGRRLSCLGRLWSMLLAWMVVYSAAGANALAYSDLDADCDA